MELGGKLLKEVQFNVDGRVWVGEYECMREWFPDNVELFNVIQYIWMVWYKR